MLGTFIAIEGPDGSGTSTHSELLAAALSSQGRDVVHTHEPTDGPIGSYIRRELRKEDVSPSALQLLFCADRAWHVDNVITPALAEGKIVVCDRYSLSTLVYGEAFGVNPAWLEKVNETFLQPDLLFLTLPPVEICMERVEKRQQKDVLEKEDIQRKVYALYEEAATRIPALHIIDTSGEKKDAAVHILSVVEAFFQK